MSDAQSQTNDADYREHRYQSHDGLTLYYREYGSGDDVVVCRQREIVGDHIRAREMVLRFLVNRWDRSGS